MGEIMGGEATPAQIGGFLVALRAKGETADEIAGCAEAMRAHVLAVPPTRDDVVDVVGTGGDGARTFNISTTAAIVAAAGGRRRREAREPRGQLGLGLRGCARGARFRPRAAAGADRRVDRHARFRLHVRAAAPPGDAARRAVRRELGTRTIFNVLGPLTNPAGARAGFRRVLGRRGADRGRRSGGARLAARVRRPRRARRRRALAGRPESRLRGRRRRRSRAGDRPARARDRAAATRRSSPAARPRRTRGPPATCSPGRAERARRSRPQRRRRDRRRRPRPRPADGLAARVEAIDSGGAAARLDELVAFSREST